MGFFVQQILKCLRKAADDFQMFSPGDRVCVGVSGGKDSMTLLYALALYKKYFRLDFDLFAVTVDLGFADTDFSGIRDFCRALSVPYKVVSTDIASIVFEERQEENPCSLCAHLRKGAFYEAASRLSCNKAAFAHHKEDVVETFFMNLLYNAKLDVFLPATYFPDRQITLIRPLVYTSEADIRSAAARQHIPVFSNPCPASGNTKRQKTKDFLSFLGDSYPRAKDRVLTAIKNTQTYHLWDQVSKERQPPFTQ